MFGLKAVAALGDCDEAEAVEVLKEYWRPNRHAEMTRAILLSRGVSRQPAAVEFLISVIDDGRGEDAATAMVALGWGRSRDDVRERLAEIVGRRGDER